jgi:hypothetical protein
VIAAQQQRIRATTTEGCETRVRRQGSRMDRRPPYGGMSSSRDDRSRKRARSRSRSRPRSRRRRERSRSRSREREPPRSRPEDATGGWGAPPPSTGGWGPPQQAQTGWGAPAAPSQGGWAASAAPVPVAPAAAPKNAEDVLREFVTKGTCCTEANPRCPISRRCGQSHHFPEATREEDCNDKGWKLKSVKALYSHCRSRGVLSGEHYHKVLLFVHGVDC